MFKRLIRAGRHTIRLGWALPFPARRRLVGRMVAFSRRLPEQFEGQPLPGLMAQLTPLPHPESVAIPPVVIRGLADAVAAWHIRSPLGICLRRSLLRYYFLREGGLPVQIVFGARLKGRGAERNVGGHAWLTLNDVPYHEHPADYRGFAKMYVYPPDRVAK